MTDSWRHESCTHAALPAGTNGLLALHILVTVRRKLQTKEKHFFMAVGSRACLDSARCSEWLVDAPGQAPAMEVGQWSRAVPPWLQPRPPQQCSFYGYLLCFLRYVPGRSKGTDVPVFLRLLEVQSTKVASGHMNQKYQLQDSRYFFS